MPQALPYMLILAALLLGIWILALLPYWLMAFALGALLVLVVKAK